MNVLKQIPDWFKKHPVAVKFEEEQRQETITKREAWAKELAQAEVERKKDFPEELKTLDSLEAELKQTQEKATKLRGELARGKSALYSKRYVLERKTGLLKDKLIESASADIDEAAEWFRNKFAELRSKTIYHDTHAGKRNLITETKSLKVYSNYPAITTALKYCQQAIRRLEKTWKLIPAVDSEDIESLKKGVPGINAMTAFDSEKPLPGSKAINPMNQFKSESQHNWELKKLNEKYEKIMRKKH